jgi:hypothetical protein
VTITVTENQTGPNLQGTSYLNFINAMKSNDTKKGYNGALRRYMNHLKLKNVDDLLIHAQSLRLIESQIIAGLCHFEMITLLMQQSSF